MESEQSMVRQLSTISRELGELHSRRYQLRRWLEEVEDKIDKKETERSKLEHELRRVK